MKTFSEQGQFKVYSLVGFQSNKEILISTCGPHMHLTFLNFWMDTWTLSQRSLFSLQFFNLYTVIFLEEGTYHTVISHLQLSENEGDQQVLTQKDQDQVKPREGRWSMNSRGQEKGERQSHCQYEDKPSWVHSTL